MRLGSLLLGGILGAAAVIYFNRNQETVLQSLKQIKDLMSEANGQAKSVDPSQNEHPSAMDSSKHHFDFEKNEMFSTQ